MRYVMEGQYSQDNQKVRKLKRGVPKSLEIIWSVEFHRALNKSIFYVVVYTPRDLPSCVITIFQLYLHDDQASEFFFRTSCRNLWRYWIIIKEHASQQISFVWTFTSDKSITPYEKKVLVSIGSNTFLALKYWKFAKKVLDPILTNTFFYTGQKEKIIQL